MASNTLPPGAPISAGEPPVWTSQDEAFIEDRLLRTRRQVKTVDLATGLLGLGMGVLVYLLIAAVLDQWVVAGGLGFGSRLLLLVGLLGMVGYYAACRLLPLVLRKVNPIYAAQTIEQTRPSLKNSLINFLFLRRQRYDANVNNLERRVLEGLEHTAAAELTQVPIDSVVDRSQVIRLGYALAAVLGVCCLYLVLSPKSPLVSFSRVMFPWADIDPPTRVSISDVKPGDTIAYQGDTLEITAEVSGLNEGESLTLSYSTADGQSVNQTIPMTVPQGEYRFRCELPPEDSGLQQNMTYFLKAGDAKTRTFQIEVQTALTILVNRVDYDHPSYTGIPDKSVERTGDLQAVEGTKVTLHATANQPIQTAVVEMDADPEQIVRMRAEGTKATARFRLSMDAREPSRPKHESYQIRYEDAFGHKNPRPIRHRINVIADRAPEIRFIDPPPKEVQLPENGTLEFKIQAQDPDFGLRRVAFRAEREKKSLPILPLLDKPAPEKAVSGRFEAAYRFQPSKLGLKAGDRVIYYAEARDNKEDDQGPAPNRSETQRRWIVIVEPDEQAEQPPPQDGQKDEPPPKQDPQGKEGQHNQEGQQTGEEPKPQEGEPQGKQEEGPQSKGEQGQKGQSGQKDQQSGENQQPQQGDQPGEPKEGQQGQEGQPNQKDQQSGENQKPQPGDQTGKKQEGNQQQGKQQKGKPSGGKQQSGNQAEGEQASDKGQQGQDSASAKPGEKGQSSDNAQPKSGQPSPDAGESQRAPVDPESNPGDAFEEILKHRDEQKSASKDTQGAQKRPGQEQRPEAQPQGQKPQPGQDPQAGDSKASKPQRVADQGETGEAKPSTPSGEKPESGQGSQTKESPKTDSAKPENPEKSQSKGGDPENNQNAGGKEKPGSKESAGSPSPQEDNQPRKDKPGDQSGSGNQKDDAAKSPSISPKQSDSSSDTPGDRSGKGDEGGGQQSKQSGTGGAGSQTDSEQGANQSKQQGEGETGSKPGDQALADRPTGNPADKGAGPGSSAKKQPGSKQASEKPDAKDSPEGSSDEPSSSGESGSESSKRDSKAPQGQNPGGSGSGGHTGEGESTPQKAQEPEETAADEVNRKFAEEAVNLSLEHLEDQLAKEKPDPKLLDRLGWSRDDLERFYRQWESMRRTAGRPESRNEAARDDWNKALRSLGLRPQGTEIRGSKGSGDQMRNLRESRRVAPPPSWAEQFRAYTESVAGGKQRE